MAGGLISVVLVSLSMMAALGTLRQQAAMHKEMQLANERRSLLIMIETTRCHVGDQIARCQAGSELDTYRTNGDQIAGGTYRKLTIRAICEDSGWGFRYQVRSAGREWSHLGPSMCIKRPEGQRWN